MSGKNGEALEGGKGRALGVPFPYRCRYRVTYRQEPHAPPVSSFCAPSVSSLGSPPGSSPSAASAPS